MPYIVLLLTFDLFILKSKNAFMLGSSKQGNANLAEEDSNWVVDIYLF